MLDVDADGDGAQASKQAERTRPTLRSNYGQRMPMRGVSLFELFVGCFSN